jgi:hypothetical protein
MSLVVASIITGALMNNNRDGKEHARRGELNVNVASRRVSCTLRW